MTIKEIENRIEELQTEFEFCDEKEYAKSLLLRIKAYKILLEEGEFS